MRRTVPLVALASMLLCAGTAALATSFEANGYLDDWGVDLTPDLGNTGIPDRDPTFWKADGVSNYLLEYNVEKDGRAADDYTTYDRFGAPNTGGEWYDIESLYVNITAEQQDSSLRVTNIRWALVTSHNYYDAWYGDSHYRDSAGNWLTGMTPTIALDLDGTLNNSGIPASTSPMPAPTGWELGITLDDNPGYSLEETDPRLRGIVSSDAYTAQLWKASEWRDAGRPPAHPPIPVSIKTGEDTGASLQSNHWGLASGSDGQYTESHSTSSTKAGQEYGWIQDYTKTSTSSYHGAAGIAGRPSWGWDQPNNWVWEGEIDTSGLTGVSAILATTDIGKWSAFYSMPCGNDYGDGIGATLGTPVPEPASCALLALAATGIGAMLRKKRRAA